MAKFSIFDHLNNLTTEKREWDDNNDEQTTGYSPYMLNRWISMCNVYIPVVNEINRYNLPKDVHYNYFLSALPKRKQYFQYIKKDKTDEMSASDKSKLYEYFEIGPNQLEEYLEFLSEDDISNILDLYNDGVR